MRSKGIHLDIVRLALHSYLPPDVYLGPLPLLAIFSLGAIMPVSIQAIS